jgi:hypothetical protein
MSAKLFWTLLASTAVLASGVALAGPPPKFKNYGQCMSYYNTKKQGPQSPDKREDYCEKYKPGTGYDNGTNGNNAKTGNKGKS